MQVITEEGCIHFLVASQNLSNVKRTMRLDKRKKMRNINNVFENLVSLVKAIYRVDSEQLMFTHN